MVSSISNTPINKMTEYYLNKKRGILSLSDFIVNSGGIIGCAVELSMNADAKYKKKVEAKGVRIYTENLINDTISKNVSEIQSQITAKDRSDKFFREEALSLAKKRLQNPKEIWL